MMAHLWIRDDEQNWTAHALDGHDFDLVPNPPQAIDLARDPVADPDPMARAPHVLLCQTRIGSRELWALVAGRLHDVRVNGLPVATGVRVLADRDEIRVDGADARFFSTERQARAEPFPGSEEPVYCARCKDRLEMGQPAVRCPSCDVWYHQFEKDGKRRPCWTYADTCALCPRSTDLDGGYSWSPASL
jgi:hypothetical protein